MSNNQGLQLVFLDFNYEIQVEEFEEKNGKKKKVTAVKPILKNINALFNPGRLCAIMGASGAGKTSFLNVVSGESKTGKSRGRGYINGEPIRDPKEIKQVSGFVFQDDLILASMTVREAIAMSAVLRLPKMTNAELDEKVTNIIKLLKLEKCQGTIVGDSKTKGVSGGERKRTAMAMELITDPSVLFLDEPTSGLDSYTAYSVIKILKDIATLKNRTVICTIHQPSSELFQLFDDILLLSNGRTMYHGTVEGSLSYFESVGFKCPKFTNPADFIFMEILNNEIDSEDTATESNKDRIERLLNHWDNSSENQLVLEACKNRLTSGIDLASKRTKSSFLTQYSYLYMRASKNAFRNPLIVRTKIAQTFVTSLIVGLLYLKKDGQGRLSFAAIQNTNGVLFFLILNGVFSNATSNVAIFAQEKLVFIREHGAGYYTLPAYFFSKNGVEIPFLLILPWLMITIIYWMVGLRDDAGAYFILVVMSCLGSVVGFSIGVCFACMFSSLPIALAATPLILLPLMIFSGFFVNLEQIPIYFRWIQWLSPMKYGLEAVITNEYYDLMQPLPADKINDGIGTVIGTTIKMGVVENGVTLGSMAIALMCIGYLFLWRLVSKKNSSHAKFVSEEDLSKITTEK